MKIERFTELDLSTLSGWQKLDPQDQSIVRDQTKELFQTVQEAGKFRLRIGEHLVKVRDVLEPRRMFDKYLRSLKFSRASAYRYIDDYNQARTILPAPVMQVALMRGTQRIDRAIVKANPPPRGGSFVAINTYLEGVEKKTREKQMEESERDPEVLKRAAFNAVRLRYERLPRGSKRLPWMTSLLGMLMTLAGITRTTQIHPEEIPDGYVVPRGRPKGNGNSE